MLNTPMFVANWKMNHGVDTTRHVLWQLLKKWPKRPRMEMIICPSFPALKVAQKTLKGSGIALGSQDMFWEATGAYTGEVSASMLQEVGCTAVILGHSERRQYLGETDDMVRRKLLAALAAQLDPIVCIGESTAVRQAGTAHDFLEHQLMAALSAVPPPFRGQRLIVAYEPLWAIGTGEALDPAVAQESAELIRRVLIERYGHAVVDRSTRVLYGGSVTPENVLDYVAEGKFDGVLVGSASLTPESLLTFQRHLSSRSHAHKRS